MRPYNLVPVEGKGRALTEPLPLFTVLRRRDRGTGVERGHIRSDALNQRYQLGRYSVVRVSNGFDWADAGIGGCVMN